VDQRAAASRRLPQGRGIPVELGAQRGQELPEGDVGVARLRQSGGHPQGRREVAPDLELALQPDQGAGVPQDGDDDPTGRRLLGRGNGAVGVAVQARERQFDLDLGPVRVQGRDLGRRADEPADPGGQESVEPLHVGCPEALGDEHGERLTAQGGGLPAQERADRGIGVDDSAVGVGDDHDVGQRLQEGWGGDS
jgi:hypothetical protein